MKKMKLLISIALMFLLAGCMEISTEVTINNDDTGVVVYKSAMMADDEMEEDDTESVFVDYDGAVIEELTYEKDGVDYVGEKATIRFNSLEELKDILQLIFAPEEDDIVSVTRENNQVSIIVNPDSESAEMAEELAMMIEFDFALIPEGDVITHNAVSVVGNTYNWDLATWLDEGIEVVYTTGETSTAPQAPIDDTDDEATTVPISAEDDDEDSETNWAMIGIAVGVVAAIGVVITIAARKK